MKKEIIMISVILVSLALLQAAQPFLPPQSFYGKISYNGQPVPGQCTIVATIKNTASECKTTNGEYGVGSGNPCYVESGGELSGKINFSIQGTKIGEYNFESGSSNKLDFALNFLPNCPIIPACGDNSCNGGETCITCSQDCGTCPVSSSSGGSSGGGSSSSGSGGGSSSSSSGGVTILSDNSSSNDSDSGLVSLGIDEAGMSSEEQNKGNVGGGITGGVIGFAKSGTGSGLIIALVIILAGIGVILFSNKNKSPENATN